MVTSRLVVRDRYAILPAANLPRTAMPYWEKTNTYVFANPSIGYAASFAEYLLYVEPGGGTERAEVEQAVESFVFVLDGVLTVDTEGEQYVLRNGGFAYLPADIPWSAGSLSNDIVRLIWIRKLYQPLEGHEPNRIVGNEAGISEDAISVYEDSLWNKHLIPSEDLAYDMNVNVMVFKPGAGLAMTEAHYMEHGLYMLSGKGLYFLGEEWHEVQAGDFIWMGPFCPQSFYAGGLVQSSYLLFKNVNRQFLLNPKANRRGAV